MPELPDVTLYLDALERRVLHHTLERVRLASPFVLRTVEPPIASTAGSTVRGLRRVGKRIVFELNDTLFLVVHLMIAGRLRWKPRGAPIVRRLGLAAFDFDVGTVLLTEAGTKKRASLHLVRGTLRDWIDRLRGETGEAWPDKVTAFRPGIAVHGRYGEACRVCGTRIARIVHAANETNYCPGCQTGGRLLADRSLSRVLHADWPKTAEELEERTRGPRE